MRQLQDRQRIVYVEDDDQTYQVVYVQRPRQKRSAAQRYAFAPLWLGLVVAVLMCFVVDDIDWLVRRVAAALVILFLFGWAATLFFASGEAIKELFGFPWLDREE